ncbi:hypothetical protein [Blastopirellula marina]|uniref:Uncharacterized protein n=1 Tax=Blastopirellula marina TaxID=124 RepID=A0A2S8GIV7_9BACT|nr:hypothetical protein [Blastopirellula marina]PQO44356.1 hypothetical protein C5Y93_20570 [Blastopirellula marina]
MAPLTLRCPDCGRSIQAEVGQFAGHGRLVWSLAYACPDCGACIEADDSGEPPAEIRAAILAHEGEWGLHIEVGGAAVIKAIQVLRNVLHLSLADAARLKRQVPGVVVTGTKTEMRHLADQLAAEEVPATVARMEIP